MSYSRHNCVQGLKFQLPISVVIFSIRIIKTHPTLDFAYESEAKVKAKAYFEKPAKLYDLSSFINLICRLQKQRLCDASFSGVDLEELGAVKEDNNALYLGRKRNENEKRKRKEATNV